MKKLTSTDLGGAPIFKDDLRTIFNSEIWAVIQAMLSSFDSDIEGLVISGCVTTANAGNFDMTAGIVYLNGEFMRVSAVTNQAFTKYIAPSTAVNDDRTFEDGTVNTVAVTKGAGLVGSAPGSGQYIKIASLTDVENRRLSGSTGRLINIGDWNMDTDSFVNVTHGLPSGAFKLLKEIHVMIRDDADASYSIDNSAIGVAYTNTTITITRDASSAFDSINYDSTSFNRGTIRLVF